MEGGLSDFIVSGTWWFNGDDAFFSRMDTLLKRTARLRKMVVGMMIRSFFVKACFRGLCTKLVKGRQRYVDQKVVLATARKWFKAKQLFMAVVSSIYIYVDLAAS